MTLSGEHAERPESGPSAAAELLAGHAGQLVQGLPQRLAQEPGRPLVVGMRTPAGSGTMASITPSSRQWAASGLNAAAAFFAWLASRQRIIAQPSGEMTE